MIKAIVLKFLFGFLFLTISTVTFSQHPFERKILINGSESFEGAFLFFPLLNDTIKIENSKNLLIDTSNEKRKLFYCCYKDEKSKIYNLNYDAVLSSYIDFKIPDKEFYKNLYDTKICPWCRKKDNVVPFIYGKPNEELIKKAAEGKVKLAGCSLSNTSPEYYCKSDKLEF